MANGTQFSIDIGANLVTDNVAKQIQALNAKIVSSTNTKIKIPIGLDENGVKQFENGIKQINTYKDSYGNLYKQVLKFREEIDKVTQQGTGKFELISDPDDSLTKVSSKIRTLATEVNKWTDTKGNINTWTTSMDSAGKTITTRVKESVDSLGNLTTETSKWGQKTIEVNGKIKSVYGQIGDTVKTTKQIVDDMTTTTTTQVGQIDDLGKSYQGLITTTEKVGSNGEYLRTVISKYTDDLGRVIEKTEQFNKANQKVATTMRKIGDVPKVQDTGKTTLINKDGVKTVTEYANGVATLRTETSQYTTALGALVTETKIYDEQTHKLIKSHREEVNNQKQVLDNIQKENQYKHQLTTTTRENYQTIEREGEVYKAVVKTIQEETNEYGTLTTTIITYKNALGETVVETQKVNSEDKHVAQSTKTVTKELGNAANNANKASGELNNLSKNANKANYGVKNLGWTLSDAFSRLANFYLASLPIRAIQSGISSTIETLKDFDSALIEFRKVSDLAGESLTQYVAKLAEMGEVTGSTMQAMVEAATEFRKSGFTDEDSAKLASIAEKYRNIADEEISAGESASFIIAQMKAFNIEADQAEHIIDAVNEVANNFSVSSADLAKNLGNMSEIMAINNVSMEQQIGMLTGVTEITRNASSASRGLVMISSRLTQVLDDTSSTGKKLTAIYSDLGIALKDEEGQLRSHYDILGDLALQWDSLSENEQKYIALTSAGARQQQNFVALMENWNQVASATASAYGSMGSAQKENEKVMDSIAKKVEVLKSQFQQLVIGKGGLQEFVKTILDVGIGLLKFANSDIGKTIMALTTFAIAIKGLEKSIITLATNIEAKLIMAVEELTLEEALAEVGTLSFSVALDIVITKLKALAVALLTNPLFWVAAVIAGVVIAVETFTETLEESSQKLQEYQDSINQTTQEIEDLKSQLEEIGNQIDDLNSKDKLTIAEEHTLDKLKEQSKEIERQIALKEQELEVTRLQAEEEAKKNLKTAGVRVYDGSEFATTQDKALQSDIDKLSELIAKQKELEDAEQQSSKEYQKISDEIQEIVNHGSNLAIALQNDASALTSMDDTTQSLKSNIEDLVDKWLILSDKEYAYKKDLEAQLDEYSKGGNVDLKLRPVIDTKELEKQGYDAGKGYATIFTHTFTNESNDLAVNFTPIITDENGNYQGVMQKDAFEKYCNDVINGVREDTKHLQIGVGFKKEDYDDFIQAAVDAAEKEHELSDAYVQATGAVENFIPVIESYDEAIEEYGEDSEEADNMLKQFAQDLGISEAELIANAEAAGLSIDAYHECALAIKEADDAIDSFQSSLGTLQSAMDEYNESQELSIDTVQALLQLQPEYLAMLVEENGNLKLNEQAIVDKCNALIEERKQTALQMAYEKLAAIERSNNQSAAESESSAVYGNADALNVETQALSKNTIEQYANRIARNDKSKGTAASQVVRELEKELAVLDKIGNSYSSISRSATKAGKSGSSGAKSAKDAQKELNKELEETKKKYDTVIKWISKQYDKKTDSIKKAKDEATKAIEKEIKALEKEKDTILDNIEAEINALEKEKNARQKYWDDQIDALKKANQEKKDALELQEKLDALEKARNTKVKIYKEGQGFVYDIDQTAVAEAQKALDEYLSEQAYENELARLEALKDAEMDNYEKRLDALNNYKDKVSKSYEEQIDALKEHKEALEEQYDAEIELYENYKQQFEDMVNAYQEQQDKLLFEQLTGIKAEGDNWMTRLDNLAEFVRKYNELQKQLDTGNTSVSNTASMKSDGSNVSSGNRTTSTSTSNAQYDSRGFRLNEGYSSNNGQVTKSKVGYIPTEVAKKLGTSTKVYSHASGVGSVKDNEIAIVGENPNQEIVIGSKLNNGELMSLNKGSGVVNADSSNTLAGMLNQVGKFGSSGFGSGNGTLNNNINNDSLTINGVTIQGANINDPQTFVNGLLNLKAEALQRAYRHR